MIKTKFYVHSDVDENNIYQEFDSSVDAIAYASGFSADDKVYVVEATVDENEIGEITKILETETIWTYNDLNSVDAFGVEEWPEIEYDKPAEMVSELNDEGEFELKEAHEELEKNEELVECQHCFELFPKENCIKIEYGYICPECNTLVTKEAEIPVELVDEAPFDLEFPKPYDFDDDGEEDEPVEEKSFQELAADPTNPDISIDPETGDEVITGDTMMKAFEQGIGEDGQVLPPGEIEQATPVAVPSPEETFNGLPVVTDGGIEDGSSDDSSDGSDDFLNEHVQDRPAPIEDTTEFKGMDNAIVNCQTDMKVIAHSEDEKPLDCKMEKAPLEKPLTESQAQEIGETYRKLSKIYNVDLEELVYGDEGFMKSRYPEGFPDFAGDVIFSEKYWTEFENWCKEKGIVLDDNGVTDLSTVECFVKESGNELTEALLTEGIFDKIGNWFKKTGEKVSDKLDAARKFFAASPEEKVDAVYGTDGYEINVKEIGKPWAKAETFDKLKDAMDAAKIKSQKENIEFATVQLKKEGKEVAKFDHSGKAIADNIKDILKNIKVNKDDAEIAKKAVEPAPATDGPEAPKDTATDKESTPAEGAPKADEATPTEEEKPVKKDNTKLNNIRANNAKILKAAKEAGLDVSKLTQKATDKNGREYTKASPELNQLRKALFGESLEENADISETLGFVPFDSEVKEGDKIRIIHLEGETEEYDGKEGIVDHIDGIGQLHGTWGDLAIIPGVDQFEIIAESLTEATKKDEEEVISPEEAKLEAHTMLNQLVADEIEAIDGYEASKAELMDKPLEHKEEIIHTIDHIKAEEKEHIDELINATRKIPFEKPATESAEENLDEKFDLEKELIAYAKSLSEDTKLNEYWFDDNDPMNWSDKDPLYYSVALDGNIVGYLQFDYRGPETYPSQEELISAASKLEFPREYNEAELEIELVNDITDDLPVIEECLNEASSAEKKAFKDGGQAAIDYLQGKAIARIKDPAARDAAIAAIKAGRPEVAKQFIGDRKEDQADAAFDLKQMKMQAAGMGEGLEEQLHKSEEALVAEWAKKDFDLGITFGKDDYEIFAKGCEDEGIKPTEDLFKYYFNCLKDLKGVKDEAKNEDLEEATAPRDLTKVNGTYSKLLQDNAKKVFDAYNGGISLEELKAMINKIIEPAHDTPAKRGFIQKVASQKYVDSLINLYTNAILRADKDTRLIGDKWANEDLDKESLEFTCDQDLADDRTPVQEQPAEFKEPVDGTEIRKHEHSIEEGMEEETAICAWCGDEYPVSELRKEVDLGYLCDGCERAIKSRGEKLTFEESKGE